MGSEKKGPAAGPFFVGAKALNCDASLQAWISGKVKNKAELRARLSGVPDNLSYFRGKVVRDHVLCIALHYACRLLRLFMASGKFVARRRVLIAIPSKGFKLV